MINNTRNIFDVYVYTNGMSHDVLKMISTGVLHAVCEAKIGKNPLGVILFDRTIRAAVSHLIDESNQEKRCKSLLPKANVTVYPSILTWEQQCLVKSRERSVSDFVAADLGNSLMQQIFGFHFNRDVNRVGIAFFLDSFCPESDLLLESLYAWQNQCDKETFNVFISYYN
jgi:hypothetical protein